MMRTAATALLVIGLLAAAPVPTAHAADGPYEGGLLRLAEILGALHFLRNLCGETGESWRTEMEALLETEKPDETRRARFIASFNRGFRSFEGSYSSCTDSAMEAIRRYMKEGESLSRDIAARYGN